MTFARILCFCFGVKTILFVLSYFQIPPDVPHALCQWDCAYYRMIAVFSYAKANPYLYAFFPGFPFLYFCAQQVAQSLQPLFNFFGDPEFFADLLIVFVNICLSSFGFAFLYKWLLVIFENKKNLAISVVILMMVDRYTLWSIIPYTESLFFALFMASLYWGRKEDFRSKFLAMFCAGLASGVRVVGFTRGLGWIFEEAKELLQNRTLTFQKISKVALLGLLSFLGIFSFMLFQYVDSGSFLSFIEAQQHWGRQAQAAGLLSSLFSLIRAFYYPTVPCLLFSLWAFYGLKQTLLLSERVCFFLMYAIPLTTSSGAATRFFSLIPLGYIAVVYFYSQITTTQRSLKWATKVIFLVHIITELGWQITLSQKYFKGEFFKWIG
jgi:hypothetical protein